MKKKDKKTKKDTIRQEGIDFPRAKRPEAPEVVQRASACWEVALVLHCLPLVV